MQGLPAGDDSISIVAHRLLFQEIRHFTVEENARVDLGLVALPPLGCARIRVRPEEGLSLEGTWAGICGERGVVHRIPFGGESSGASYGRDGVLNLWNQPIGSGVILFGGKKVARAACAVEFRADAAREIEVPLETGVWQGFDLRDPGAPLGSVVLELKNSSGVLVALEAVDTRSNEAKVPLRLAPGPYLARVRRETGAITEQCFHVAPQSNPRVVLELGAEAGTR